MKVLREPVPVFEVLGDSTEQIDNAVKNAEYAAVPSIRRYIILSQHEGAGRMFERAGDARVESPPAAHTILQMPEIGIDVAMSEFYEGVMFASDEAIS